MLSLRQFDNTVASLASSGLGSQLQEHMESTMLQFGAQHSNGLPALIAPFAHPVHVDVLLSETALNAVVEDAFESRDMMAPTAETVSCQNTPYNQTPVSEPCV